MKKLFFLTFLTFITLTQSYGMNAETRARIGSTFTPPLEAGDKYYFVATTGVLYETDKTINTITKLYDGKKQTLGSMILHENRLYWGDGLHTDEKSFLHVFDLKTKKMLKEISLEGHIERAPLIHGRSIFIPTGPAGLIAYSLDDFKLKWWAKDYQGKKLHIDSNLLMVGEKICATTVYDLKGVICFDAKNGKATQFSQLTRDPKSEISIWKKHVVGFATEGNLTKPKWDIPADFYLYDVENDKMKMSKELRGFNFFAPVIQGDEAFIALSTGDFILMELPSGKIHFMGEFPEPFSNNTFMKGQEYCSLGIMGKYRCFTKTKSGFALSTDRRLFETVIGRISFEKGRLIAPYRIGFIIE